MPIDPKFARGGKKRIDTDNRIQIESGPYEGTIKDVWVYYVDENGRYTRDREIATGQRIKLTIAIDDSAIVLKDDMPMLIGDRTLWSARVQSLTGITDRSQHAAFDEKTLLDMKVIATLKCEQKTAKETQIPYWWTAVKEITPREIKTLRPPSAAPADPQPEVAPRATASQPTPMVQRAPAPRTAAPQRGEFIADGPKRQIDAMAKGMRVTGLLPDIIAEITDGRTGDYEKLYAGDEFEAALAAVKRAGLAASA